MLKLVKTINGHGGSPKKCSCGSIHFMRAGVAWHCSQCGIYFPTDISKSNPYKSLQNNLDQLNQLHGRLKGMLNELEELVKE